ncbi:ulp1 protease family, C-terminal catalytic domain-containing protein, partial [Tanacetum coccineum]
MDRNTWMYTVERYTAVYMKGLNEFMKCAEDHRERMGETRISCPCKECRNIVAFDDPNMIRRHLIEHGFDKNYTCWDLHGEAREPQVDTYTFVSDTNHEENDSNDDNHQDNLDEMLHDAEINVDEKNVKKLQQLFVEAEKALYNGSFLEDNELPVSTYKAKKLTWPMGLEELRYKHKNLTELDIDVKKNGPPAKMLWYLPIIPRLKKLYANPKDAKLLRWHAEEHKNDGKMRHVADSLQWNNIDPHFKKFRSKIRNIQFRLCPKQPGNDIDVYLRPLIDDMIDLWEKGVEIYDAYKKQRFQLFVMIYCTINDFPAYENLSGYGTKGEKACPVPSGYSANIKNLVSMKDLKLLGMKSHDCHVLLTQMIPIAIRGLMPPQVRQTITKLCLFFNMIHSKVLDHEKLEELQRDIILILCQLEMYFPPSFFDVMVHLVSHIVEEIKIAGPVFLRYMYPFERYMGFLKGYVRNRYRPEGSIIQGYAAEEVVQFCTNYMDDVTDIGLPQPRHQGRLEGVGTIGRKDVTPNTEDLEQAHFTVLQNMTCIEPYIQEHMSYLARKNGRREQRWLEAEHKKTFSQWLADKVIGMSPSNVNADVIQIGYRPRRVLQYQGYDINGYTFYTKKQDDKSTVQNSGVTLIATTTDSSRMEIAKDSYYGVIDEIWELDYTTVVIPILKCKWVDNTRSGVKVDNDGFTCVNLSTNGYLSDPFILAKQVDQVFYVEDPLDKNGTFVLQSNGWEEERNDPDKTTELHLIPDLRSSNYCLVRAPRDKVGIKPLPAELIDVSNKLVQAASELSQSSNESKSGVDPLIMVLGPEHGGRTRGVGCDIGYKKGVEGYVRKKRTSEQRKDNEEIRNEVRQQMKEELKSSDFWLEMRAELKVELRNEILAEHNLSPREDDVPSSVELKSSLNSTTNMVRNESQGQQNESFSPRQDHRRLNLSSTKSIVRKEQQGEQNESSSTKPVDVSTSVFKIQCIKEETYGYLYVPSSALLGSKSYVPLQQYIRFLEMV